MKINKLKLNKAMANSGISSISGLATKLKLSIQATYNLINGNSNIKAKHIIAFKNIGIEIDDILEDVK